MRSQPLRRCHHIVNLGLQIHAESNGAAGQGRGGPGERFTSQGSGDSHLMHVLQRRAAVFCVRWPWPATPMPRSSSARSTAVAAIAAPPSAAISSSCTTSAVPGQPGWLVGAVRLRGRQQLAGHPVGGHCPGRRLLPDQAGRWQRRQRGAAHTRCHRHAGHERHRRQGGAEQSRLRAERHLPPAMPTWSATAARPAAPKAMRPRRPPAIPWPCYAATTVAPIPTTTRPISPPARRPHAMPPAPRACAVAAASRSPRWPMSARPKATAAPAASCSR